MQKICCIGTHGSGKTTLCYQLATYYKVQGKNVNLINEVARSCPFPINEQFNAHGAMWIVHSHIKEELEAMSKTPDIIVCDRSPIDTAMYAKVKGCNVGHLIKNLFITADDWMDTYDKIYYVRPDGNEAIDDGVRSTDESFRKKIEDAFDDWMEKCSYPIMKKIEIIKSSQIFSDKKCWIKEKVA